MWNDVLLTSSRGLRLNFDFWNPSDGLFVASRKHQAWIKGTPLSTPTFAWTGTSLFPYCWYASWAELYFFVILMNREYTGSSRASMYRRWRWLGLDCCSPTATLTMQSKAGSTKSGVVLWQSSGREKNVATYASHLSPSVHEILLSLSASYLATDLHVFLSCNKKYIIQKLHTARFTQPHRYVIDVWRRNRNCFLNFYT
jgi:hypothetical protein